MLHLWNYPRILFEVLNDEKKEDEVCTEREWGNVENYIHGKKV